MTPLRLVFLGTNGWYATPMANTVCALIETPQRYIVLDAGDGIWRLDHYVKDGRPVDIFLSHFHLDHTIGLHIQPKFRLMKNKFRIFGQPGTKKALATLVNNPFTAPYELLKKQGFDLEIRELGEGENKIDEYSVRAAPLVHADPCWGYRFEMDGKIISYCTDTGPCENLVALSRGADALITECGLLPGAPSPPSWPHLNPEMGAQAAKEAGVKKLFLTHFAAHLYESKQKREEAQAAARKIFAGSTAAMDGMETRI
ncbi:Ribonuclease Z [uncultured archaeon]|nr:Ribonuclease Z [uncultured archaeon]